jgi:hypothetical protein
VEDRNVIIRDGDGSIGTASFVALLAIAAVIALFILQPWDRTSTHRFTTTTTQQYRSDAH